MKKIIKSVQTEVIAPAINFLLDLPWKNPRLLIKTLINHFNNDSLYKNSVFLMLSTLILSIFGFFFWTINARLYTTEEIGLATSLISLITLLSGFSSLGLNAGLIRFLPKQKNKNGYITTIFIVVSISSIIFTSIYLFFLESFSPRLMFIRHNLLLTIFFIIITILSTLNLIKDSIFITYRDTKYGIIYNLVYSITRLVSPFFLIFLGAIGIFISHAVGIVTCMLLTIILLYIRFNYKFHIDFDKSSFRDTIYFSLGSYSANLIGSLPSTLFPLVVLNQLGPKISAYYYIVMMIISFLYMIPISISNSLFAEGSHNEKNIKQYIYKSFRINFLILIPTIIITIITGKYVLHVFGEDYVSGGLNFLRIMSLSTLIIPFNYSFGVYMRIKNNIRIINVSILASTITTLVIAYFLVPLWGLYGMAGGLILGQITQLILYIFYIFTLKFNGLNNLFHPKRK